MKPASPARRAALLKLCGILAPKDKKAAAELALALDDPPAYFKKKRARMDERSIDEPEDVDPATALIEALGKKRVGEIDWKWQFPDILHAVKPQWTRHKVKATDWAWTLEPEWDEVDTEGCLKAAGGFLAGRKLVLGSIDFRADAYALIVVDAKTFAAAQKTGKSAGVKVFEWKGKPPAAHKAAKGAPTSAKGAPKRLRIDKKPIIDAFEILGDVPDRLVFSAQKTAWVDTSRWPPKVTLTDPGSSALACNDDGRWLSIPAQPEQPPLRIHPRWGAAPDETLTADPPVRKFGVVGWVGNRALAIPSTYGTDHAAVPYLQDGKVVRPAP